MFLYNLNLKQQYSDFGGIKLLNQKKIAFLIQNR